MYNKRWIIKNKIFSKKLTNKIKRLCVHRYSRQMIKDSKHAIIRVHAKYVALYSMSHVSHNVRNSPASVAAFIFYKTEILSDL